MVTRFDSEYPGMVAASIVVLVTTAGRDVGGEIVSGPLKLIVEPGTGFVSRIASRSVHWLPGVPVSPSQMPSTGPEPLPGSFTTSDRGVAGPGERRAARCAACAALTVAGSTPNDARVGTGTRGVAAGW